MAQTLCTLMQQWHHPSLFSSSVLTILVISLHHLQANSQYNSSFERAVLLSLNQHWGYSFSSPFDDAAWKLDGSSSYCDWPYVDCNDEMAVTGLFLSSRGISGTIPSSICQLQYLVVIHLSDNYLGGSIPSGLSDCSSLQKLDLSGNQLSGTIPGELFLMKSLVSLYLSRNRLQGIIPTRIEEAVSLERLDLSNNHNLNGSIPDGITHLHNLRQLDLSANSFSGEIPTRLFSQRRLQSLNLCNNKFSGMVPYEFVNHNFEVNCLDPSNLCSRKGATKRLPICPFSMCAHQMCAAFNKLHIIIIIALGIAAIGAVRFIITYYWVKRWKSKRSTKEEQEWKMISFQGLKFETTDILSSLTDDNLIGHGGSGKVYRVFTNLKKTYVAVKSISFSEITDHRAEKEFLAEIHTLGATWHYNIVKLLCYISGPETKLLVYEYFENNSLDRWLHGSNSVTKLDWPTRMNIAIGAAQGLCYMHHHCPIPIVHRDIKSSNILLDSDFNAKIADFGLAKLLNNRGDTQTASAVAGTFGYIAPEYAYTSKVNAKSDVYSFGVVLLELTTGRRAVTRGDDVNLGEWAHLQCKDTSATFDALDVSIKEAAIYLDQIISVFRLGIVCTTASPSNRPSMKDCLLILQNYSNNITTCSQ